MGIDGRIGKLLGGKWRVDAVLGRGGTSTVYAATHVKEKTRAALKVMHPELSQNPGTIKMLLAEAKLVAAIDHPGTVKVLDEGAADDGCSYLVFELLVGQSLEDLRQAHGGRIPLQEMMPIGDAVMDALRAVHEAGVVHRDLKPHNIFVLEGGGVKLLDFGFAKLRGYTADAAQNVFGTPSYMPPEQAMGLSKKIDAQSDVWALGATLFHVLSGQSVHTGKHIDAMMLASANARPRSLHDAAPELPSKVTSVVDRSLSYMKAERFPDMAAMRSAWQDAHPHWLPTLPPPCFEADPNFIDASLLQNEPMRGKASSLFDPRELLGDSVNPMAHPGALPDQANGARRTGARSRMTGASQKSITRQSRLIEIAVGVAAVVFLAFVVAAVVTAGADKPMRRTELRR